MQALDIQIAVRKSETYRENVEIYDYFDEIDNQQKFSVPDLWKISRKIYNKIEESYGAFLNEKGRQIWDTQPFPFIFDEYFKDMDIHVRLELRPTFLTKQE